MQNTSPNRERLAARIAERVNALALITAESANANRLSVIHDAIEPARRALEEFDAGQASAYARWAKGGINGRPKVASAIRAELVSALADAEQSSAAAKAAQDQFQAAAVHASAPLPGLDLEIRKQAKIVAIEEAAKLLPAIKEAITTAENLHGRLEAARAEAMAGIAWGSVEYGEVNAAVNRFDQARGLAEAKPKMTADPASWRRFTAALERDAGIDFESAQAMAIPTSPFVPAAADAATAAMLAAAAYPSNGIQR
jgi:hypothetical protein